MRPQSKEQVMKTAEAALANPVRIGLVGAGRIGTSHATLLARHVPGADLLAVADPRPGAAQALAGALGCRAATDPAELFADPDIEAVVITAASQAHADLVVAAVAVGQAVFC
jgi:myo-inositol 2-dehydrogenase / D-chiro-inositol 1-dehydrogenase